MPSLALDMSKLDLGSLTTWLPVLGLALIVTGLMMSLRKRRQAAARPTAIEQLERSRQTRAMQGDLEELMVEIERLTRRFAAQLDAKTQQLESLMREADQRIATLQRLREVGPDEHAVAPSPFDAAPGGAPDAAPLARRVGELADRGLSPVEIARELDEHVGKIELVLALRKAS